MRTYSRTLKTASAVTLAFFLWSFGPLFQIPAAFAAGKQETDVRAQTTDGSRRARPEAIEGLQPAQEQRPEEKFQDALERIRDSVEKEDVEKLKAGKAEIEKYDIELKKQFKETEEKIKNLSETIKQRHRDFVAKYEENLSTLKTHLDNIERAKTKDEKQQAHQKAKAFLEKTKRPSRHVPLDPNRLPHRTVRAKERAPRLDKREFERDFPKQKSLSKQKVADIRPLPDRLLSRTQIKPVLLAYNDIASDIPFSLGVQSVTPQMALADSTPILLTQATEQPTADDLAETPEVQFTDAIRAKAQELGGNPVRIYEWVRNNIEYAPTYGSIQGADQCLQSKICNDFDTASLLIALLRVSGIYAHYVYGTIEVPIEKAMNWVGGVTSPMMAGTILATNGIPAKHLLNGGRISALQLEHVWVSAFIDYIPSRGAVHKQGDTWIPLDPSYKQYTYTQGIDIASAVPFDAQTFVTQLQSTATINEAEGYVTNVNSALIQQTMQDYQTQVQNYISQNYPNATVGDMIGKKEIKTQVLGILPVTLPYKIVQTGVEFAQLPNNLRATISFSIPDFYGTGLSYSTSLPQIAGKKITLSFSPATANDEAVIQSLLPQPNPDGTIDPSQFPSSFPAYLINLVPELRVDGQVVATGVPGIMGSEQSFTMSLNEPGIGVSNIDNIVKAGEYFGIGVDTGRIGAGNMEKLMAKLEATKTKIDTQNYDGLTRDVIMGDLLHSTISEYFSELDFSDEITAKSLSIIRHRAPSIGMFSLSFSVVELFGIPKSTSPAGINMDIDRIMQAAFSKDGNMDKVKQYMLSSGMMSSSLEHSVPEQLFSVTDSPIVGISAVKALKIANDQGIPIFTINQGNINTVFPLLQLEATAVSDIQNAVNAGKTVVVSKSNITFNGWRGCGYIVTDPATGAGAYMISGNLSGAWIILGAGAISGLLIGMGIVAVGAFFTTCLPLFVAIIGAFLIGLGIGLFLSQILSDNAKAQLGQILRTFIRVMTPFFLGIGSIVVLYAFAFAMTVFVIMEICNQLALIEVEKTSCQ